MVIGGSRHEAIGFVLFGTRQQGVPVVMRELMLPDEFGPMSPSFTVRDVFTEIFEPEITCSGAETYLQLIGHSSKY
ncbi:unnamed protein product [Schistosoma margrebowiei]|uniref:Uncharacterized protein n=1 Tax=Schistosoma margrebowiei TaxID=48269 RepID=A0A183LNY0_9TREM|nr:unnamed protein product [Schistosoma margrebowiei]